MSEKKRASAGDDPAALIYERISSVDLRALPLGPEEAFVLSRVDGKSDTRAIAGATGLGAERVAIHLYRLEELGAVRPRLTARENAVSIHPSVAAGVDTPLASDPAPPSTFDVAAAKRAYPEVDESLDIPPEIQVRILELSAKLGELTHFEVLGVPLTADRSAVKRAYFSMIGDFHPDSYFGKSVGGFTKRMEKIFQRLTEAHDVLSNAKAREEYESYLKALGHTRRLEAAATAVPDVQDLEQLLLQAEREARQPAPPRGSAQPERGPAAPAATPTAPAAVTPVVAGPVSTGRAATGPVAAPAAVTPPAPRVSQPAPRARVAVAPPPLPQRQPSRRPVEMVDDPAARRQALARKLGLAPPPPRVSAPPPSSEAQVREQAARRSAAVKDLHQRYQHRRGAIREQRIERFARVAEEALASGNAVSALNALRIAQTLSGGDIAVMERLGELEQQLGATVADTYLERARYEETNGNYEQAARSYTHAARGRPSADVLRSAAECYLKAGVDLRTGAELAREAVQLSPERVDLRLTLAKIYEAAGMQQSLIRELERALELTPGSERITTWLKRVQRGGV